MIKEAKVWIVRRRKTGKEAFLVSGARALTAEQVLAKRKVQAWAKGEEIVVRPCFLRRQAFKGKSPCTMVFEVTGEIIA